MTLIPPFITLRDVGLKSKTISGVRWFMLAQGLQRVFDVALSIAFARLLVPSDFGIVAIVTVIIGFGRVVILSGIEPSIFAEKELNHETASSLFWLTTTFGAILFLALWSASPWIVKYYQNPNLDAVNKCLSTTILMSAISIVPNAFVKKALRFQASALISAASTIIAGVSGLVVILNGGSYWGLVTNSVVQAFLSMALPLFLWRPKLVFNFSQLSSTNKTASDLMGFNFINYLARNLDDLLAGKYLGLTELGIYSRAYYLITFPVTQINGVLANVMMPSLAQISDDLVRLKRAYLKTLRMISFLGFPVLMGLFAISDDFLIAVWGEQWIGVDKPLRILCVAGVLQTVAYPTGWLYIATKRTRVMFLWGSVASLLVIASFLLGILWRDLNVLCLAYSIVNLILFFPTHYFSGKIVNIKISEFLKNLAPAFTCALAMGALVAMSKFQIQQAISSPLYRILIEIPLGAVIYYFLSHWLQGAEVKEAKHIIFKRPA